MRNANEIPRRAVAFSISFLLCCSTATQAQTPDWQSDLNAGTQAYNRQDYATAIQQLQSAVKLCGEVEPDSTDLARCLVWIGFVYKAAGRYAEAEPLYKRSLDIREKKLGPDHPDVASSLNNLAALYLSQGRYAEAEPLYKRSLEIREKKLGPDHPNVASSLNNLANLYYSQGRYAEAEPLYKRALDIYEKKLGPDHPDVATSLNNLAELYNSQGRYAEAEPLYKRALDICEKKLGPDHPDVATSLNNLAALYNSQGRYAEAEPLYKRSLDIREKKLGPDHPDVAQSLNNLAALYNSQGRYAEAEPLYKRSLDIREKKLGPDHPDVAQSLNNLANLYYSQGRYAEAEPLYKRSLDIREKKLGPDHPYVATSLNNLALLYWSQGRYAEAEPLYKRALDIREKKLGPDHPDVAQSLNNLANLYYSQGRYAEAEPLYKRALDIYEKKLGPDHPDVATSLNNLAELYNSQGRYAEAEPLYKRSLDIYEKKLGPDHPDVAQSLNNLAELYYSQGRYAEAEPLYKRSLDIREKKLGPDHPNVASSLNNLANLYYSQGRYAEAEPLYKRSLDIDEKIGASPLAARGLALKALALSKEITLLDSDQDPGRDFSAESAHGDVRNLQVPRLLSAIKSREAVFGPGSAEVGDIKLQMALVLVGIGALGKGLAQDAFPLLKPLAEYLVPDSQTTATNTSGPSAALAKTVERLGGRQNSLRKASSVMLCLAYILADAGVEEKSNSAASLALACSRGIAAKNATAQDAEQLLSVSSYFEIEAQYANSKEALDEATTIARNLQDKALISKSMLSLARVDMAEGDYASAVTMAGQALHEIESQPALNLSSSEALDILADCSEALGRTDEAIKYSLRALKAKDPSGSGTQADLLPTLLTLGELQLSKKDCGSARKELDRAVAIAEPLKATTDRGIKAATFSAQGDLALSSGDLEQARLWYSKARDINFHADGKYLAFARNLNSLARLDSLQSDLKSARSNVLWSSRLLSNYATTSFGQLSFAEQCTFVDSLYQQTDLLLSMCTDPESLPQAYGYIMKWKGLLIESLRKRTALQKAAEGNPAVQPLVDRLAANHNRLKILADEKPATEEARKARDAEITELTSSSESIERLISQKSGGVKVIDPLANRGAVDVQKLLSDEEAIVDISGFRNVLSDKDAYAAIILTHGSGRTLIKLGDADAINDAIGAWRASADVPGLAKRNIGVVESADIDITSNKPRAELTNREQLRKLLWRPIASALPQQIRKIWLCPDSDAAVIPWGILPEDARTQICTIDSPREFVSLKETTKDNAQSAKLLLAGGITFSDRALDLPGTRLEFRSIKEVADNEKVVVEPFSGTDATERAITAVLPACTYAHFATHGFYSGSSSGPGRGVKARGVRSLKHNRLARGDSSYLIDARNPLMSSGLLLSVGQVSGGTTDDGKLTADDIVGMDLHKCSLVTLSACETGLGKKMSGQGVIGLRSAILGAGARSIVMSLWKVDDAATCRLMKEFYTNLLANHQSPLEALSLAQNTVRKVPGWEHPYYWAGWVLAGDGWQ